MYIDKSQYNTFVLDHCIKHYIVSHHIVTRIPVQIKILYRLLYLRYVFITNTRKCCKKFKRKFGWLNSENKILMDFVVVIVYRDVLIYSSSQYNLRIIYKKKRKKNRQVITTIEMTTSHTHIGNFIFNPQTVNWFHKNIIN